MTAARPNRPTVHVLGAGLAGLACALDVVARGDRRVVVHEAAGLAGGRCRSWREPTLGCEIDNGNHLLMGAYAATLDHVRRLGAADELVAFGGARFDFVDVATARSWTVRPNRGPLPWWVFAKSRRIPGTTPADYLEGAKLLTAGPEAVVADRLDPDGPLFETLWRPLVEGVMNCTAGEASAAMMGKVLRLTFGKGAQACRPIIARHTLGRALIDPALRALEEAGAEIRYGARATAVEVEDGRAARIGFARADAIALHPDDTVVVAVRAGVAAKLLPDGALPEGRAIETETRGILNAHFRFPNLPGRWAPQFFGVLGGMAQWVFLRDDVASITVSVSDAFSRDAIAGAESRLRNELAQALALRAETRGNPAIDRGGDGCYSPCDAASQQIRGDADVVGRLVTEKQATILQTPAALRRRPPARTRLPGLILAGDWTDTGLPATIEGAIRSGRTAAAAVGAS